MNPVLDKRSFALHHVVEPDIAVYGGVQVDANRALATDGQVLVIVDHRVAGDFPGSLRVSVSDCAALAKQVPTGVKNQQAGLDVLEFDPAGYPEGQILKPEGEHRVTLQTEGEPSHTMIFDFDLLAKVVKVLSASNTSRERKQVVIEAFPQGREGCYVYRIHQKGRKDARAYVAGAMP